MNQLDPRSKLFLAIAYVFVLIITTNLLALAAASAVLLLFVAGLRLTRAWLTTWRVLLPMIAFFLIVMLITFDPETALGGALRLIALTTTFFIFFQSTAPEDLANALVASRVPYAFAFILTTAMQYVPILSRKAQDVMDAQRARGIRLERDLASIRNYPALFTPLLIQSFSLADQLAEAMEARGFGSPRRTFAQDLRLRARDFAVMALGLMIMGLAWHVK